MVQQRAPLCAREATIRSRAPSTRPADPDVPPRMKLAVDPSMLGATPLPRVLEVVAEVGYRHVELPPRADLLPSGCGRRVGALSIDALRRAVRATGVEVASLFVVSPWASPDEAERAAAVRYLEQACEVAVELGCPRLNTELTGDP